MHGMKGQLAALASLACLAAGAAQAQQAQRIDIASQPLASAMLELGRKTGLQIVVDDRLMAGRQSVAVSDVMTPQQALGIMLGDSGFQSNVVNNDTLTMVPDTGPDGSITLGTIVVGGGGGANWDGSAETVFEAPGAVSVITTDQLETFRGTNTADLLKSAPGLFSSESRASGGLDVNIRGLQGQGRVAVTVDGTSNSNSVYRSYQGIGNSSYVDPDFIAGVSSDKSNPPMGWRAQSIGILPNSSIPEMPIVEEISAFFVAHLANRHVCLQDGLQRNTTAGMNKVSKLLFGGRVLDLEQGRLRDNMEVLIEGDRIVKISDTPIAAQGAERIDISGKVLMPGLIDAHVHVIATLVNLARNAELPSSLIALRTREVMHAMLMRGFTTVRDLAGADLGIKMAVEEGLIDGPRLMICGKALSQTVGHCDYRSRFDTRPLHAASLGALGRIADGVDEVRRAAREEIKAGAEFIKIMANGGVSSSNDPIHVLQYSIDEIRAIVEEAENYGLYVAAHTYTDASIRRAVECGVKSLEHCNLIEPETARLAAEAGAIACPTLVAYEGLALEGKAFGLSKDSQAKIDIVRQGGLRSLAVMRDAGLPMAFGSDLLGELHKYQSMEFEIRSKVLSAKEILASTSTIAARLCRMEGQIGTLAEGAFADLIVVDGNPLEDITLLAHPEKNIAAVMKGGTFFKNTLDA